MFLIGGFERVMALVIQISLSIIVFVSVIYKGKKWLFPFAILLHAIIDSPAALFQTGLLKSIWIVEGLVAVEAVVLAFLAIFIYKNAHKTHDLCEI